MRIKFINYKPVFVKTKRWLRIAALCALMWLLFNAYISGSAYLYAWSELEEAQQNIDDSEVIAFKSTLNAIIAEKEINQDLLDVLSRGNTGVQLDKLLATASDYKPRGIDILAIGSNSITGYGTNLEGVTQFIKSLSDELGAEVDVRKILQLELFEAAIGFELGF